MSDSADNQHRITIEDLSSGPNDGSFKKEEPAKNIPVEPLEGVSVVDHPPPYEFASADSAPAYSAASVSAQTPAPVGGSGSVTQQIRARPDDSPVLTRIPLKKKYGGGECCCPASRGKCCCIMLILIVILFVILGIIAKTNNDACNNLSPDGEDKIYYSYDPNIYTNFSIDSSDSYIQNGNGVLLVFQNPSNVTNATIWVQMAAPGRAPAHIDFTPQQSNYQMRFHQSSGGSNFLGIFGMSASCIKVRVGLVLPQQTALSTIQADNFDIQTFHINAQFLNVKSINGDVFVDQLYANDITLSTGHGDVVGDIGSLRNIEISSGGSIDMWMNVAPNVTNSNISAISYNGYAVLRLNNSFVGTYDILSNNGEANRTSYGTVGTNGTGTLKVAAYQGNAVVRFF